MKSLKTILLAAALAFATPAEAQTNFGAIPRTYPTYSSSDPLGFQALSNALSTAISATNSTAYILSQFPGVTNYVNLTVADATAAAIIRENAISNALHAADLAYAGLVSDTSNALNNAILAESVKADVISNALAQADAAAYVYINNVSNTLAGVDADLLYLLQTATNDLTVADAYALSAAIGRENLISNTLHMADVDTGSRINTLSNQLVVADAADRAYALSLVSAQAGTNAFIKLVDPADPSGSWAEVTSNTIYMASVAGGVTNRTALLSFTNGIWQAIATKVSTNDFIAATNSLTLAVNSKVGTSTFDQATNQLTQAVNGKAPASITNTTITIGRETGSLSSNLTFMVKEIYNPTNSLEFIDGARRVYYKNPIYTMTFSADFDDGLEGKPSQSSYVFTNGVYSSTTQDFWVVSYRTNGFQVVGQYRDVVWEATTNSMILDNVSGPGSGYAIITQTGISSTNLVNALMTTNHTGNVSIDGTLTANSVTIAGTNVMTTIAGKVDNAHTNDATAHPELDTRYPSKPAIENNAEAGRCWGGDVSATNGTIYIKAGGGFVKAEGASLNAIPSSPTNGAGSALVYVSWAATNLTALVGYNIVYWDASDGYFKTGLKDNMSSFFDFTQDFTVGRVWYDTTYGPVARLCGMNRWSKDRRQQIFHEQINPVRVGSGGVVASSGLSFSVSAAEVWAEGENYFQTSAKAATNTFYTWYQTNTVWVYSQSTNVTNDVYNVTTGDADGLATMTNNRWRADYVYLVHDGSVHLVLGQAQYTSATLAETATRPTPPPLCAAYGTLIARITIKKGDATMTVANNDNVSFSSASIPDHNSLGGLQGGTAGEYYHLTAGEASTIVTNAALSIPYRAWTGTITPANGTATVTYAVGNMPSVTITASPTVLTLDPTSYGTSGVSRVSLSLYCGTNTVTLSTNVITYTTTPTLSTNSWNTILIRRVSNDAWKGVQL